MVTKIQKWGNSLALRIPKALAAETGLDTNSPVEIRVVNGQIHIVPVQEPRYELDALLDDITAANLHGEANIKFFVRNEQL